MSRNVEVSTVLAMRVLMRDLFDRLGFRAFLVICSMLLLSTCVLLGTLANDVGLTDAAVFMAGAYGLMSSAAQSQAIIVAGPGYAGRANATYYAGLDLGMSLGPMLGGAIYGGMGAAALYPALATCVLLAWVVWLVARR